MDAPLGSIANSGSVVPRHNPSVLIVESHPKYLESLPRTLKSTMPQVMFDVSASRDESLSKLKAGRYHAVIGDARLAEADDYSLLKHAQTLTCPVPFVLSEKSGDREAVRRALMHGALDIIRSSYRGTEASEIVRRALWLYQLRLTIYNRRERLNALRLRHERSTVRTASSISLVERTYQNIEEADRLCERTIDQIASSLRVLEDICRQAESEARECAIRMARLL